MSRLSLVAGTAAVATVAWAGSAGSDPLLAGLPQPDRFIEGVFANDPFKACKEMAVRERRFGDVTLHLRVSRGTGKRRLATDTKASRGLGPPYEACIRAALPMAKLAPLAQLAEAGDEFIRDVMLGEIRPLLPDKTLLLPAWRQASADAAPPSRKRLAELVGPDVRVSGDGCLQIPETPALQRALELWLRASAHETSLFWQDVAVDVPALLGSGGPRSTRGMATFVVDDDWVATYDYSVARSRTARESNLLCLVQLTGARKQALLRAMTQATHCQLTEAADALVWPRPSLPATPARAIATSEARVCAVDSHGALTCCGRPRPLSAPAVPVTSWTQTKDYGCGLDANHHIVCSGLNIPAGADGAATFTQISAGPAGVCGVDVAQRISCWGGGLGPPAQDAAVTFSSVDATGSLQCGVTTRHEVRCWSEGREVAVRGSDYASVSTSSCGACAVTTGGDVRCWDEAGHDRPSVIPSKVRLVSDRCSYGCALDESGQPSCWGQEDGSGRTHPPRRVFRAVQSAPSYSCAVDERGNVACWGALQASSASSYTRIRNRMNTDLDTVTTPNEKRR